MHAERAKGEGGNVHFSLGHASISPIFPESSLRYAVYRLSLPWIEHGMRRSLVDKNEGAHDGPRHWGTAFALCSISNLLSRIVSRDAAHIPRDSSPLNSRRGGKRRGKLTAGMHRRDREREKTLLHEGRRRDRRETGGCIAETVVEAKEQERMMEEPRWWRRRGERHSRRRRRRWFSWETKERERREISSRGGEEKLCAGLKASFSSPDVWQDHGEASAEESPRAKVAEFINPFAKANVDVPFSLAIKSLISGILSSFARSVNSSEINLRINLDALSYKSWYK